MRAAQKLYEGVDLSGEGSVALITYMRTDSTRVSNEALQAVRGHIGAHLRPAVPAGEAELLRVGQERPGGPRGDPADRPVVHAGARGAAAGAERAAPARPDAPVHADLQPLRRQPDDAGDVRRDQRRGHGDARTSPKRERGSRDDGPVQGAGQDPEVRRLPQSAGPGGKQEDATLPALTEKQPLDRLGLTASQHFTQPPPRYNEASLIKALEKEGIGRPSTYASIIHKITSEERGYIEVKERRFYATEIGKAVTDLLVRAFPARHGPEIHQPHGGRAGPDRDAQDASTARC